MKKSGVLLHITSLPGCEGIGTLGKGAFRFVDFLSKAGAKIWQVLPIGPTGFAESPYQSTSTFAGNPMMIDLETLYDQGLTDEKPYEAPHADFIDFETARARKDAALRRAYACSGEKLRPQVAAFEKENDWTSDYALFMAAKNYYGGMGWMAWPDEGLRLHRPEAVSVWREKLADEVHYQLYLQYLFRVQWFMLKRYANEHGITLFGDMPIYVAEDSADTWSHPECFLLDENRRPTLVAGVPPDYFSEDGQLWGNPIYNWKAMKAGGYEWWLKRFACAGKLFDLVRVDHFIGFANYYTVKAGATTARNGKWVNNDGRALFRTVKKTLPDVHIAAENLGVLSERVEKLLAYCGFPGMKVLQFSFGGDACDPAEYPENCICYTGTHDNPTTAAWWENGASEEEKNNVRKYLGTDADTDIVGTMIRAAYASACDTTVVPMQDWLALPTEYRMNAPGTVGGSNWRWRLRGSELTDALAKKIRKLAEETGRL